MDRPGQEAGVAETRLRAARQQRGWSQSRLIHELDRQARADGVSVPGRDSLRCMISRWENGRIKPDEVYRTLLSQLYGLSETDLGFAFDPTWRLPTPPGAQP
jgi:transcriptional regulator with XRE-family HTH domain